MLLIHGEDYLNVSLVQEVVSERVLGYLMRLVKGQ